MREKARRIIIFKVIFFDNVYNILNHINDTHLMPEKRLKPEWISAEL